MSQEPEEQKSKRSPTNLRHKNEEQNPGREKEVFPGSTHK